MRLKIRGFLKKEKVLCGHWHTRLRSNNFCMEINVSSAEFGRRKRKAFILNLFMPGMGQFYLQQWKLGTIFSALFLGSFLTLLGIFLFGMSRYFFILGGDLNHGNEIEKLQGVFHVPWLIGFVVVALMDLFASLILVFRLKPRNS